MNRKETEQAMMEKLTEIVDIYHQYNPNGTYLAVSYVDGYLSIWNAHYGSDSAKPINVFRASENDITEE